MTPLQKERTNLLSEEDTKWWRQPPRLFHPPLSLFPQLFVFSFSSFFPSSLVLTFPSHFHHKNWIIPPPVLILSQKPHSVADMLTTCSLSIVSCWQTCSNWGSWTHGETERGHTLSLNMSGRLAQASNSSITPIVAFSLHPEIEYGHKATQVCECTITDQGKLCKENSQVIR